MTKEELHVLELLMTIMETLETDTVCDDCMEIKMQIAAIN